MHYIKYSSSNYLDVTRFQICNLIFKTINKVRHAYGIMDGKENSTHNLLWPVQDMLQQFLVAGRYAGNETAVLKTYSYVTSGSWGS